ncbi:MAG: KpsF/GutQ family sugar-phosphate isomerase, partial [Terriglobales bacterium]
MSLTSARRVLAIETRELERLAARLDERFEKAMELCLNCRGRVVVAGMGKSGLIGRKISATLAST